MGNVATKLRGCFGEKTFIEKEHTDNYTKKRRILDRKI